MDRAAARRRQRTRGSVARRSFPASEVRGGEELPHARGQGRRPGGANPRPGGGSCAGAGGLRGAPPQSRSGERPGEDAPRPG